MICYSVKANSTLAILSLLARAGCGFDIVSGGELFRVIKAGGDPGARRLLRRRQDGGGDRIRARKRASANFNCESEGELGRDRRAWPKGWA